MPILLAERQEQWCTDQCQSTLVDQDALERIGSMADTDVPAVHFIETVYDLDLDKWNEVTGPFAPREEFWLPFNSADRVVAAAKWGTGLKLRAERTRMYLFHLRDQQVKDIIERSSVRLPTDLRSQANPKFIDWDKIPAEDLPGHWAMSYGNVRDS